MHLALIPDAETLAALRRFAPRAPQDLHLTVIHSKAPLPESLPLPATWPLILDTQYCLPFGGKQRIRGLRLRTSETLQKCRSEAESILFFARIEWSKQWLLVPHISLGAEADPTYGNAPTVCTFDRLEWRP